MKARRRYGEGDKEVGITSGGSVRTDLSHRLSVERKAEQLIISS